MRLRIGIIAMLLMTVNVAMAQDVIVKKDGTILNVYNLEEGSTSFFYTLEPSADAAPQRISKADVFSTKKQNGTATKPAAPDTTAFQATTASKPVLPTHDPVKAKATTDMQTTKKGVKFFSAQTPDGHTLNYTILSDADKMLAVTSGEYNEEEYVIPEYVEYNGEKYTVIDIGEKAFYKVGSIEKLQLPSTLKRIDKYGFYGLDHLQNIVLPEGLEVIDESGLGHCKKLENVVFPSTLKVIGFAAFGLCQRLKKIILPEGLEEIGMSAFWRAGEETNLQEIYLPSSIKTLGENAFIYCSCNTSFAGYCQTYFSNMPDFITEGNCKSFGIDEEAVRAYNQKKK